MKIQKRNKKEKFWPQNKNNNEIKKGKVVLRNRSSIYLEFEDWNLKDTTKDFHSKVLRPQSNLVKIKEKRWKS